MLKGLFVGIALLSGSCLSHSAPSVHCATGLMPVRLEGFDGPRVPNSLWIAFKQPEDLVNVPTSGPGAPRFLPEIDAATEAGIRRLAEGARAKFGGTLNGVYARGRLRGFFITGPPQGKILNVFACDPRVRYIGVNAIATVAN